MVSRAPSETPRSGSSRSEVSSKPSEVRPLPSSAKRQQRHSKPPAQDASGLKDYQLGDRLGKGAFGSVYRALNMNTGETVAVKQIRLADLPKSELRVIMLEIDLLKNLDHPNIVKYHGFVKTPDTLNIILEYCENGSLHSISKNFGKFPENLVGLYMSQVLEGLVYLHEQGVIHRDIKGANILTTKQGLVKLADFGVASKTTGLHESTVVGTPYWMAPEVIELSGATTASDIWSLGCTVIELLDGKPPYYKLQPMPALFRIVNDDHPPLPEGASPAVRDFLMQCFQKDPNLRVSAKRLLKHPWIVNARRVDSTVTKKPTQYEEAVKSVQQWNEALKSPDATTVRKIRPKSSSPIPTRKDNHNVLHAGSKLPLSLPKPQAVADKYMAPETDDDNWDNDFITAITPNALRLPHLRPHDNFGGMLSSEKLKAYASLEAPAGQENFDADLGSDFTIKSPNLKHRKVSDPLRTIRPTPAKSVWENQNEAKQTAQERKTPLKPSLPPSHANSPAHPLPVESSDSRRSSFVPMIRPTMRYRENSVEDYSDLIEANEDVLETKLHVIPNSNAAPDTALSDKCQQQLAGAGEIGGSLRKPVATPRQAYVRRSRSSIEIQKFAEDEQDEDFSDVFGRGGDVLNKAESEDGSDKSTLMLNSKLSNQSWLGDEDDEDDPFAQLEEGLDEQGGLEENIARDKYARVCAQVEGLVDSLKIGQTEEALADISEQLMDILTDSPDIKHVIVSAHGMLPMLEILDSCRRRDVIFPLLRVVNEISFQDVEIQENLCFVGGIPIINKYASRKYPREIRLEAAAFVRQMFTTSTLTLQMLVSAGGLNVLVEFLEEDYDDERDLVLIGVDGICSVFELQGPTPKNDFCRILSRNSLLDPLSLVLNRILDEEDEEAEMYQSRIANIFLLFSQAENYVKETVADRTVLHRVLKDLKRMSPSHQITMLKFIKNLSMLSSTLDTLQNSNAIDILTELLNSSFSKPHFREMSNQILNTIFNLCRLSKSRQEDAALNGVIPLLQKIVKTERPLKEFALPILCDMAHSGKACRRELWRNKGLKFYISLLSDPYWQVTALDAIFIWLQEETAKVEEQLLDGLFTSAIVECFTTSKANAFENLLEPLQKLLRLSPPVAATLARPDLFSRILQKLHHGKTVLRLNLLRIVRSICDACEEEAALLSSFGILDAIEDLAKNDPSVLVRNMAAELVKSNEDHQMLPGGSNRRRTMARRTSSSNTPPGLLPQSVPSTPRTNRSIQSSFFDSRDHRQRSGIGLSGPSLSYRPASRDGSGSSTGTPVTMSANLPVKSRLPRTSTNRLSMGLESPRKPENMTPTGSGRMGIAVANARRRRQGSQPDSRWS